MNDEIKTAPKPISPHALNKNELRVSMYLPIVISVGLVVLGGVVWLITPDAFNIGLAIGISVALLLFLLYWTRHEPTKQRVLAVAFAVPALVGISFGMSNGRLSPIILGVSLTILLLVIYRAVSTPISYRFAVRQFEAGNDEHALELVDKTIAARPSFWESYQLKALIYLSQLDFPRAERAAKEAIDVNPQADFAYNTLGQIYLAQADFAAAKQAYIHTVELQPDNALYWYHLGLCQYRLKEFETAVDSLLAATKRSPRILEYELLTHYYLWCCLKELGRDEQAGEVEVKMQKFSEGVPLLQSQIAQQPDTPNLSYQQADIEALATAVPQTNSA